MAMRIPDMRTSLSIALATSLFLSFLSPRLTYAAIPTVVISEVAWAGSSLSDADEWIELTNLSSDAVEVTSWTLLGAGSSGAVLTLPFGTIAPGATYLISNYANGNPKSVLQVEPQFVTTSVSVSNTSFSLTLKNAVGEVVDVVSDKFAGSSGAARASMERISLDDEAMAWKTATVALGLRATGSDFGTPGSSTVVLEAPAPELPDPTPIPEPEITPASEPEPIQLDPPPITELLQDSSSPPAPPNDTRGVVALEESVVITSDTPQDSSPALPDQSDTMAVIPGPDPGPSDQPSDPGSPTSAGITAAANELPQDSSPALPAPGPDPEAPLNDSAVLPPPVYIPGPVNPPVAPPGFLPLEILINEFSSDPVDGHEWIELKSQLSEHRSLDGYWIEDATTKKTLLNGIITAHSFVIIGKLKSTLNNGGDVIRLFAPDGTLVDEVSYDVSGEIAPAPKKPAVAARIYTSGGDRNEFSLTTTSTPGAENVITSAESPSLTTGLPVKATTLAPTNPSALGSTQSIALITPLNLTISGPTQMYVQQTGLFLAVTDSPESARPKFEWFIDGRSVGREEELRTAFRRPGIYLVSCLARLGKRIGSATATVVVTEFLGSAGARPKAPGSAATVTTTAKTSGSKAVRKPIARKTSVSNRKAPVVPVVIEDIVTVPPGILGANIFLIGEHGLRVTSRDKKLPALQIGDRVKVRGTQRENKDGPTLTASQSEDIAVVSNGHEVKVDARSGDELTDENRGELVLLRGTVKRPATYSFILDDGSNTTVSLKRNAGISSKNLHEGDEIELTGVVQSGTGGLRVVPRSADDLKVITRGAGQVLVAGSTERGLDFGAIGNFLVTVLSSILLGFAAYHLHLKFGKKPIVHNSTV